MAKKLIKPKRKRAILSEALKALERVRRKVDKKFEEAKRNAK